MILQAREQKVAAQRRAHEQAREEVRQAAATREKEIAAGAQPVLTVVLSRMFRQRCRDPLDDVNRKVTRAGSLGRAISVEIGLQNFNPATSK